MEWQPEKNIKTGIGQSKLLQLFQEILLAMESERETDTRKGSGIVRSFVLDKKNDGKFVS